MGLGSGFPGEIADFNKAEGYGGELSPKKFEACNKNRILRPKFLETILLKEPYRNNLTYRGVRIVGAWFKEAVDLSNATIPSQLSLHDSRFKLKVDLSFLKLPFPLSLKGSVFVSSLILVRAKIEIINMSSSTFKCALRMNSLEVGSSLIMRKTVQFADVDLVSAKIKGQLDMSSSTFKRALNMNSLEVGGHLLMRKQAQFASVNLTGAKIGGQLDVRSSTFKRTLIMNSLEVGSHLLMRNTVVEKPILLTFARIQGNLDISGAVLSSLNLTGTKVVKEFRLGSGSHLSVQWKDSSELILRNTEVGNLQDVPVSRPDTLKLHLDGFVYHSLGGLSADDTTDMATRDIPWLKGWLGKQKSYSPRPYQQLSTVLRNAGYEGKATAVFFEGKKRQQEETKTCSLNWWLLVLQRLFIGYGYRNFRVFGWGIFLWVLGTIILYWSGQDVGHKIEMSSIAYSIDMLLPIIELHKPHYTEITLQGWVRGYFYMHKVLGYVLASFLIAGLSGLTKK